MLSTFLSIIIQFTQKLMNMITVDMDCQEVMVVAHQVDHQVDMEVLQEDMEVLQADMEVLQVDGLLSVDQDMVDHLVDMEAQPQEVLHTEDLQAMVDGKQKKIVVWSAPQRS